MDNAKSAENDGPVEGSIFQPGQGCTPGKTRQDVLIER